MDLNSHMTREQLELDHLKSYLESLRQLKEAKESEFKIENNTLEMQKSAAKSFVSNLQLKVRRNLN